MFSVRERENLRDQLVASARTDNRIRAAALVGSAADGREDQWSDIDLALRLAAGLAPDQVATDWTSLMYQTHHAVAHFDIWSSSTLYRVFLLANSLQIDLTFWPSDDFAQSGGPFRLLFGGANAPVATPASDPAHLLGMGWLYALHIRSSIARGRPLQALFMINGMRDQVVALACLRHNLPSHQGRGVDDLPSDLRDVVAEAVPGSLGHAELVRSFACATRALLAEAHQIDTIQAAELRGPLEELVRTASSTPS